MANKKLGGLAKRQFNEKALALVQSRFSASSNYTQGYFTRFQRYYELYRSYLQAGSLPWRSNLFIPKVFEIVETIAPRIAQAQRRFTVLPVEGSDVQSSEAYSDLLKYWFEKTDMEDVLEEWVKETLIYGTGVTKISWLDGKPRPEVIDIFDFFPDPKARSGDELKYAIHRMFRDLTDLKKNPNYDNAALKLLEKEVSSAQDSPERQQRLGVLGISAEDGTRTRFQVLEYHGDIPELGDGKIYLITVVGTTLLRAEESPYNSIPFVVARDTIVPHEFYGIGEIEPLESLQNELNDIRNQRMDNVKLNINTMWKVVAGGVQFEDELISQPGGVIHLTRPDGLLPNDHRPLDGSAFTEESIIKSDMERTSGANSPLSGALTTAQGGSAGGALSRTASAFNAAIAQSDKRFNAKVNQVKRGLVKVGRLFLEYAQKFMDKPQMVRILGEDGDAAMIEVTPEDIKERFDLTVDIDYLDDAQQIQQALQIAQYLGSNPTFDAPAYVLHALERAGQKNLRQFLRQPPPPPPPQPEPPKINIQVKGEATPDAIAQILNKTGSIESNPEVVAAMMQSKVHESELTGADVKKTKAETLTEITPEPESV